MDVSFCLHMPSSVEDKNEYPWMFIEGQNRNGKVLKTVPGGVESNVPHSILN